MRQDDSHPGVDELESPQIAIAKGLAVYTCNPNDFVGTNGLDVMPVDVPSRR